MCDCFFGKKIYGLAVDDIVHGSLVEASLQRIDHGWLDFDSPFRHVGIPIHQYSVIGQAPVSNLCPLFVLRPAGLRERLVKNTVGRHVFEWMPVSSFKQASRDARRP